MYGLCVKIVSILSVLCVKTVSILSVLCVKTVSILSVLCVKTVSILSMLATTCSLGLHFNGSEFRIADYSCLYQLHVRRERNKQCMFIEHFPVRR